MGSGELKWEGDGSAEKSVESPANAVVRTGMDDWPWSTRLETRTKETNVQVFGRETRGRRESEAYDGMQSSSMGATKSIVVVAAGARMVGPERWWTMPGEGEAREILVEARSRSDVQIDGRIWV